MKKLSIIVTTLIILLAPLVLQAQNQGTIISDFRKLVGEPDSVTGAVTRTTARAWLNMGIREFAPYGVFMKESLYVGAANRDTFRLPVDYISPYLIRKTIRGRKHEVTLSDTAVGIYPRTDTVVLSTTKPDNVLTNDVMGIVNCYKKNATDKVVRPLIQIPPDSLDKVGRALATRMLSPIYLSERIDTVVLSTTRPDTTLKTDVFEVVYAYKKNATDKAIRPLIKLSDDSLDRVGRALVSRTLPPEFLSERIDTVVASNSTPLNLLRSDVFDVRSAFRKDKQSGKLLPVVKIAPDSLQKIATNPSDYFYFVGQPIPRIVLGQKSSLSDTIYLEVLVASDFYAFNGQPVPSIRVGKISGTADTLFCKVLVASDFYAFNGQPFPTLTMGKIPTSADSCFCLVSAIIPQYTFYDTGSVSTTMRGFLRLDPPLVSADTVKMVYVAELDSLPLDSTSSSVIQGLPLAIREALKDYMAAQFYAKKESWENFKMRDARWRSVLEGWAITRRVKIALPSAK